jgi:hypothetical protein
MVISKWVGAWKLECDMYMYRRRLWATKIPTWKQSWCTYGAPTPWLVHYLEKTSSNSHTTLVYYVPKTTSWFFLKESPVSALIDGCHPLLTNIMFKVLRKHHAHQVIGKQLHINRSAPGRHRRLWASDARYRSRDSGSCVSAYYSDDRCLDLGLPAPPTLLSAAYSFAFLVAERFQFGYLYHFFQPLLLYLRMCCWAVVQRQNRSDCCGYHFYFNPGLFSSGILVSLAALLSCSVLLN